ncbi:MAG: alpha/beta hydrolase [Acidobacteriota bacterium]
MRRFRSAFVAVGLALTVAPTFGQPQDTAPAIDADVVYGHKMGMALTYDVVSPATPNGAAVLFMVSGGWVSRWFDPSMAPQQPTFSALLERGFTVFMVRHGSSPMFKVPEAVVDVRKALAHIRDNASAWNVDADRLGVFGGSAGGHLSLMLGAASESAVGKEGDAGDARVAAVVAYFPPVDLQPIVGPNDRFPALDFDSELADDISPVLYVSKDDPPTLLVHGTADELVPLSTSQRIHAAFQKEGVTTELVVLEGAGHGFRGEHEATATEALVRWFSQHLDAKAAVSSGAE